MPLIRPLISPPINSINSLGVVTAVSGLLQWFTKVADYHSYDNHSMSLTSSGGGALNDSEIYASYFGKRGSMYEMYVHFRFNATIGTNKLGFSIPQVLDFPERYGGNLVMKSPTSDTFEIGSWIGKNNDTVEISATNSFPVNTDRVVTIHSLFMEDY